MLGLQNNPMQFAPYFITVAVWDLAWKGVALWKASQRKEKGWFVVLLIVNSAGILPIIYLLATKNKK